MTVTEWALFRDGRRQDGVGYPEAVDAARSGDGFVWVGLSEPDQERWRKAAADFGLHPLVVEDALDPRPSPKLAHYDGVVSMVLRTVRYVRHEGPERNEMLDTGALTAVAGAHFVLTVARGDPGTLDLALRRLEEQPKLLAQGPTALLYTAADVTVDGYLDAAEEFEEDLTEIEAAVFADVRDNQAERIYRAKRELLTLRRAVLPLSHPVRELSQPAPGILPSKIQAYFREVSGHLDRVHTLLAGHDETIASMLQANLAQLSVSQNNDMRKITSWAAIIAVPTAIAGIYGMNFRHMPELRWELGYPGVMLLMAAICLGLYWNFKRRGWL
ncbi:magnesium and cobalt transport protein CorA [Jiangella asiatica]|uniref:magnesium and cobalt transport protein CorA n=1 Tax=Jiangella asiatica TaxID=2530372 RepID=UPI0013A5C3E5|nr:magnesium and cobalt transport protein CorA [Jiangella asiatica]